jgi:hypothetical protein
LDALVKNDDYDAEGAREGADERLQQFGVGHPLALGGDTAPLKVFRKWGKRIGARARKPSPRPTARRPGGKGGSPNPPVRHRGG